MFNGIVSRIPIREKHEDIDVEGIIYSKSGQTIVSKDQQICIDLPVVSIVKYTDRKIVESDMKPEPKDSVRLQAVPYI